MNYKNICIYITYITLYSAFEILKGVITLFSRDLFVSKHSCLPSSFLLMLTKLLYRL